jgi:hypothetical protein
MQKDRPRDRLAAALSNVSHSDLRRALVKDTPITFRATKHERDDMHRMATACGLTLTDYLIRLHRFASQQLSADKKVC